MFEIFSFGYFNSSIVKPLVYQKTPYSQGLSVYQLEFCTNGNGSYMINHKEYIRQYGSIILLKPNEVHSHFYKVAPYECYTIHFTSDECSFEEKYLQVLPSQIFLKNTHEIMKKFQEIIILNKELKKSVHPEDVFEIKKELLYNNLRSLIMTIYLESLSTHSQATSFYKENIENVKKYISKNFKNEISAKDMAQIAHLSEGFTYRQFKKLTGQTPHEYLLDIRLNYACSQLILTNDPISKISLKSGFKNPTYLNIIFKKTKGMTPMQYRKENQIHM